MSISSTGGWTDQSPEIDRNIEVRDAVAAKKVLERRALCEPESGGLEVVGTGANLEWEAGRDSDASQAPRLKKLLYFACAPEFTL